MWLPGAEYNTRRDRTLKPAEGPSGEMLLLLLNNGRKTNGLSCTL